MGCIQSGALSYPSSIGNLPVRNYRLTLRSRTHKFKRKWMAMSADADFTLELEIFLLFANYLFLLVLLLTLLPSFKASQWHWHFFLARFDHILQLVASRKKYLFRCSWSWIGQSWARIFFFLLASFSLPRFASFREVWLSYKFISFPLPRRPPSTAICGRKRVSCEEAESSKDKKKGLNDPSIFEEAKWNLNSNVMECNCSTLNLYSAWRG